MRNKGPDVLQLGRLRNQQAVIFQYGQFLGSRHSPPDVQLFVVRKKGGRKGEAKKENGKAN